MKLDLSADRFIDRKVEQELFNSLLQFQGQKRLLIVSDRGGRGKSHLLKRLAYICEWERKPPTPVSLVPLDQLKGNRPIVLVERIRKDLGKGKFELEFKEFDRLNEARKFRKAEVFGGGSGPIYGQADLQNAKVESGGKAGGIVADTVIINKPEWTPEIEELAAQKCMEAFVEDLRGQAKERGVVILLDAVDSKADQELRQWAVDEFTENCCLNRKSAPERLVLVLAGRESFSFAAIDALQPIIESRESLSHWEKEHVKAFLELNGCENASDALVDLVTEKLKEEGVNLLDVLMLAKALLAPGLGELKFAANDDPG